MKKPTFFYDTTHALKRGRERGLALEQMKEIVISHEWRIQHRVASMEGSSMNSANELVAANAP